MPARKTYAHLSAGKRVPTDYEVVSTRLLYYPARGFEVSVPLSRWYERYQTRAALTCSEWERFADPRQTTYASYCALQRAQEAHVEGVMQSIESSHYDERLSAQWVQCLGRGVAPMRFALHGLQMTAAYVGQMSPSGKIVIAAAFQAADEMRRIQWIARRIGQLRAVHPTFADDARERWQEDPAYQPLRRTIERLLVTYDWTEALLALNVCVKPMLDELLMGAVSDIASSEGDPLLGQIFFSLDQDCQWHRAWTKKLLSMVLADGRQNAETLGRLAEPWHVDATEAFDGLSRIYPERHWDRAHRGRASALAYARDVRQGES